MFCSNIGVHYGINIFHLYQDCQTMALISILKLKQQLNIEGIWNLVERSILSQVYYMRCTQMTVHVHCLGHYLLYCSDTEFRFINKYQNKILPTTSDSKNHAKMIIRQNFCISLSIRNRTGYVLFACLIIILNTVNLGSLINKFHINFPLRINTKTL